MTIFSQDRTLEHPDITAARETGYPLSMSFTPPILCYRCGDEDASIHWFTGAYCRRCALKLAEDMRDSEIERLNDLCGDDLLDWAGEING